MPVITQRCIPVAMWDLNRETTFEWLNPKGVTFDPEQCWGLFFVMYV